jgi:glycosyltransferase involved in cell wall biosynthesis
MSVPTIAVIVPTRNRAHLLQTTLRSILSQRGVDFEVVIVDDGSTGEQASAIQRLRSDSVRIHRHDRSLGVSVARNAGVREARAPWIAFCDDDDLWTPDKLADQLAAATKSGRSWAYAGAVKFEEGPVVWQLMPSPSPEDVQARLAEQNLIPAGASNVLVERDTLLRVGAFDESLGHLADWDLWLRLLEVGMPASVPGIRVAYRLHPGAMSLNPRGILAELETLNTRWRHARGGVALDPGPTHLWIAMSWLRAGHRPHAAASYLRAVRSRPRAGLRGLVRVFHPHPPKPAYWLQPPDERISRFKQVKRVELPADIRQLLHELAGRMPAQAVPR